MHCSTVSERIRERVRAGADAGHRPVSSEDLTESWEPICMIGLVVSTACPVQDSSVSASACMPLGN